MHRLALNTDLSGTQAAPEWVELIPAGPEVISRDGRRWQFDNVAGQALIERFRARNAALPIDWEHASQHRAPHGQEAPAAAWIRQLDLREGALFGQVEWTERAANQIAAREYRYLSPVFDYEPASGRIVRLVSAGLTNLPNLHLSALNTEESSMLLAAAITAALGLSADASPDEAVAAIAALKTTATAANREQTPKLDQYVPRADYDALLARATNAERCIADRDRAQHQAAVDSAITEALTTGKITPATETYHRAACTDAEGLARFRAFVTAAPVIGAATGLGSRKPEHAATALNAEEQAVCTATGITPEQYLAARSA